jgi:hypothetical protein
MMSTKSASKLRVPFKAVESDDTSKGTVSMLAFNPTPSQDQPGEQCTPEIRYKEY